MTTLNDAQKALENLDRLVHAASRLWNIDLLTPKEVAQLERVDRTVRAIRDRLYETVFAEQNTTVPGGPSAT